MKPNYSCALQNIFANCCKFCFANKSKWSWYSGAPGGFARTISCRTLGTHPLQSTAGTLLSAILRPNTTRAAISNYTIRDDHGWNILTACHVRKVVGTKNYLLAKKMCVVESTACLECGLLWTIGVISDKWQECGDRRWRDIVTGTVVTRD